MKIHVVCLEIFNPPMANIELSSDTLRNRRPHSPPRKDVKPAKHAEAVSPKRADHASGDAIEKTVSSVIDVFKGLFVFFMLTEHTRSSLHIDMSWSEFPLMHIVSQVAVSLDMTSFSTAYGFSCQRSYFSNEVKQRSLAARALRAFRSVMVIMVAAFLSNITFDMAVRNTAPSWGSLYQFLSLQTLYWDFLTTFPLLMLMGFFTTRPALDFARSSPISRQLFIYTILLGWPLIVSLYPLATCPTVKDKYYALFLGCIKRSSGAMRFSACSYMFFFNLGAIASETVTSYIKNRRIPRLVTFFFSTLLFIECLFAVPLIRRADLEWEYMDWEGYRRFPMSPKLTLGWAFLSFSALCLSALIVKVKRWLKPICDTLEHMGANVLLYLFISNLTINGFFHNRWSFKNAKGIRNPNNSDKAWEYITVAVAVGEIIATRFIIYLARSGRK